MPKRQLYEIYYISTRLNKNFENEQFFRRLREAQLKFYFRWCWAHLGSSRERWTATHYNQMKSDKEKKRNERFSRNVVISFYSNSQKTGSIYQWAYLRVVLSHFTVKRRWKKAEKICLNLRNLCNNKSQKMHLLVCSFV